jgi:hypothetical protein
VSDVAAVVLIGYVQGGLLLAWYLYHRRATAIRAGLVAEQQAREAAVRELQSAVAGLRDQVGELKNRRSHGPLPRDSRVLKQAQRRGALEMARRGMDARHIADVLSMRCAEVEMLLRMEQLRGGGQASAPDWIESAS